MKSLAARRDPPGLRGVLRSLRILSPRAFTLGGRRRVLPEGSGGAEALAAEIARALYAFAYCGMPGESAAASPRGGDLAPAFARAFRGADRRENGWTVLDRRPGGAVEAGRDGSSRLFAPGDLFEEGGGRCTVRLRRTSTLEVPGFVTLFPEWEEPHEGGLLRLYWNASAGTAVRVALSLARALDARLVPYRAKAARYAGMYARRDSVVLYLRRSRADAVLPVVHAVHGEVADLLEPGVPLFTRRLARGLGLAEDPGGGRSFGTDRCRLLAEAAVRSFAAGRRSPGERWEDLARVFAARGLSLEEPHREPGPRWPRPWPPEGAGEAQRRGAPPRGLLLRTADRIAGRLCRDALWSGPRCGWLRPRLAPRRGAWVPVLEPTGADLHEGSAGIGLFLAEAFRRTGDGIHRRTALGALRHALSREGDLPAAEREGLHGGAAGLALSLLRAGDLLGEEWPGVEARRIARALGAGPRGGCPDLLGGTAGAVILLLHLQARDGGEEWRDGAVRRGDRLLRSAVREGGGLAWRRTDPGAPSAAPPLCGLSHGASGIGWALLELGASGGGERFLEGARAAFSWERRWFDPARGGWPDLREAGGSRPGRRGLPFTVAWCHGAAGIGLVRARAAALLGDAVLREEAEAAAAVTARTLDAGDGDGSLCHGDGGRAGALAEAGRMLGIRGLMAEARRFARERIEEFEGERRPWPCGVRGGGEGPSLMTGIAGIGHHLLVLDDPAGTPSVLLPVPGRGAGAGGPDACSRVVEPRGVEPLTS